MALDLKQSLKLNQQLLMTPQLQQAIKLLQFSRMELEEFVASQIAENPVLEEGTTESAEEKIQVDRTRERTEEQVVNDRLESASSIVDNINSDSSSQDFDWESFSRQSESSSPISSSEGSRGNNSSSDDFLNYENMVSKTGTLHDHLMSQLGEISDLEEDEKDLALFIIGNIDDKGYLQISVEEISQSRNASFDEVEDMLDVVQRLDPAGIAARSVKECLLLQVRNKQLKNGIVEVIIDKYLKELETRNFQAISKNLKISLNKVIENIQIIADLEPIPGRQFGGLQAQYIAPDVYVFKLSGEWKVVMNDEGLPKLRMNDQYQDMLKSLSDSNKDGKNYLQDKVKSAQWLIKSIQQRQRTIFRVTEKIVERQNEFFEHGVEKLKPMILKDVAEDIGMHESTISRVTSNKFVHTPQGIFELKYFFSSSVSVSGGDAVASEAVKNMIVEIVKKENPKKPLADQKIVEQLEEKGIQLARRTVAKYREHLGILPSSKRKKHY